MLKIQLRPINGELDGVPLVSFAAYCTDGANENIFLGYVDCTTEGLFQFDEESTFWQFLPSALRGMKVERAELLIPAMVKGLKIQSDRLNKDFENWPPSEDSESGQ